MTGPALTVERLCKSFGGVQALRDLSFSLGRGEVLGLIGPNGSGKSTTVNVLAGTLPATSGSITLDGAPIERLPEHARVSAGLARTFQTARNFPEFTVRRQVELARHPKMKSHPVSSVLFGLGAAPGEAAASAAMVRDIIALCGLEAVAETPVAAISAAEQRFLMIATALAAEPKVVLLDEPAAGLVKPERRALADLIRAIRARGVSVLVIEHHMSLIMEVCDRIVVLNFGAKIAEGTPEAIRADRAVIDAYLGEAA